MEQELLTVTELARYLKVRPWTIYNKANSGQLPAVRMFGRWRFRKDDIDKWLNSNSVGPLENKISVT